MIVNLLGEESRSRVLRYFSKGCVVIYLLLASWRILVEYRVEALQRDVPGQLMTDFVFAGTWVAILFFIRNDPKLQQD